ncbi:hypothetical protein TD95_004081 [Thielaviopsis punctulata]|uniref:C3H1-type domain-containing protein n=1 Tax=Thielaviopsis punctulata TaxID=72032 RepID=A0A0F4ZK42_9PEZI|nr:hypothetical protein TD95_004081 [Thielaviopsis punctulata]
MGSPVPTAPDIASRWQSLSTQWDEARSLIQDLMMYCSTVEGRLRAENDELRQQVETLNLDLSDAVAGRRNFQAELYRTQEKLHRVEKENAAKAQSMMAVQAKIQNANPYVIALIDGDGLLFKESYVKDGLDGGKRAAKDFRDAIRAECGIVDHDDTRIEVKIFAHVTGLSRAMKRDGSVTWEQDFKEFTLGFTQALSSFDFIDVGVGKERADSKIKELTRWHIKSPSCKHLLLGISHDAGYAPFLDEIFTKNQHSERISLIEGFPTHKDIARTGINIINMTKSVFRADKLVDRQTGLVNDATPSTTFDDFVTVRPTSGASPPRAIKPLIPAKATSKKVSTPTWNPGPRGLDPPVSCTQASMDIVKKRAADRKPCNVYYLRDVCPRGFNDCPFDHRQKMSKDEKNAIAFLSRTNPCQNGQDCPNEDCIYGHNCPTVKDNYCTNQYCKFTVALHPPGCAFRNKHVPDN